MQLMQCALALPVVRGSAMSITGSKENQAPACAAISGHVRLCLHDDPIGRFPRPCSTEQLDEEGIPWSLATLGHKSSVGIFFCILRPLIAGSFMRLMWPGDINSYQVYRQSYFRPLHDSFPSPSMPHVAEPTMTGSTVNGEVPSSKSFNVSLLWHWQDWTPCCECTNISFSAYALYQRSPRGLTH